VEKPLHFALAVDYALAVACLVVIPEGDLLLLLLFLLLPLLLLILAVAFVLFGRHPERSEGPRHPKRPIPLAPSDPVLSPGAATDPNKALLNLFPDQRGPITLESGA
jgi:hypothetical protein